MSSINTNMGSINAQSNLAATQKAVQNSLSKLSSGYRITKAADDAAGLAISEKMRGQISGLKQASSNAQSAISLIQTGEGGLSETQSILQRMRELAVQSASDTNTADDRKKIQSEVDQLGKEITRISNTTEFNTQNLLAGGLKNTFQIGANKDQNITLSVGAMDAQSLGVAGDSVLYGLGTATTGVSAITAAGHDLVAGDKISTLAEVAATKSSGIIATTATKSNGSAGALTGTTAGAYNGASDATLTVRVDSIVTTGSVGSGNLKQTVSAASVSTDGGNSYTKVAVTGSGAFSYAGMNLAIAATTNTTGGGNAVGDTQSFKVTAEYKKLQLTNSSGTAIGGIVNVYNNMTSAVIGQGDHTASVTFNFTGLDSAGGKSDAITKTSTASTAAQLSADGTVSSNAITQKGINVSTQTDANLAIKAIDQAINTVSQERSKLGAMQNRLEHTIANLGTSSENLTSAESNIRDVDMAAEMSKFTKNQVLAQAGVAMLAQANQAPQTILKLLQ
ncbi:flagellin [Desulfosporosinus metallidurans]|uniref:Flagellin n=1 Tax=Desulfosporosinus metallidurans TaxID=1888891 RepID=A0A1Q8R1Q9_9FIRM|nr:flagellin [Desulfosporosinus metallidurans]OLN33514.1 Flagellin protein FlaA [Desulfosporosinus metallidurans]